MADEHDPARNEARDLAHRAIAEDDALGWFEELYARANGNPDGIPWADLGPSRHLFPWIFEQLEGVAPGEAIVIGCGLGDDAEHLAAHGWSVTAFDVSATAIDWCRERFPDSQVNYRVEDLFELPDAWAGAFDLVFEVYTLQAIPVGMRERAVACVRSLLSPGGYLALATRVRADVAPPEGPPWPLHPDELSGLGDLTTIAREHFTIENDDDGLPPSMMRMIAMRPVNGPK